MGGGHTSPAEFGYDAGTLRSEMRHRVDPWETVTGRGVRSAGSHL